ncbi:MAG: hypothetical protein JOZ02_06720, partial [Acidobacteria bacterium]|nr:hypothetical protein [Acidobacteriota bacterium]
MDIKRTPTDAPRAAAEVKRPSFDKPSSTMDVKRPRRKNRRRVKLAAYAVLGVLAVG